MTRPAVAKPAAIFSATSSEELREQLLESGVSNEDIQLVGDGQMTVYLHSKRGADIPRHHYLRHGDRMALRNFKPGPPSLRLQFSLAMNRTVRFLFR